MKTNISRRSFVKTATLASGTLLAGSMVQSCSPKDDKKRMRADEFPSFGGVGFTESDGVAGLLFSQIGYESGYPVRVVIRLPAKSVLNENASCRLTAVSEVSDYNTSCRYWGELWGSHWWIAEFRDIPEQGEWDIELISDGECVFYDSGLIIRKNILWDKTIELGSADMLERRVHFTKVGAGWQDAGTLWVESCSQSAMVISLADLVSIGSDKLDAQLKERIYKQITVGCNYLVMTQEKASQLGFPPGAMSHDLLGHEKDVLPNDAMKAVIALSLASVLLPDSYKDLKTRYRDAAEAAYRWLTIKAKPLGNLGLSLFQRGLPENTIIPSNEWQTRDLVALCWAGLELWKNKANTKDNVIQFARQIMDRQIAADKAENGYYGHFLEYSSMEHSEKSWIHGIVNNNFGADIGGIYPNYLLPLVEMLKIWPEHEDAEKWKETLRSFTYNYLIPACEKNPFLIVPQGIFGNEGPVWFCGTFHGTNTIYGFTAALAFELAALFNEPALREIAYGNLLWLAGLNAGITKENLNSCVIYSADIPGGVALPVSMMCGVGKRWAGSWFATRGVICNGFSTGKQFVYDTEPKKANDGPFSLTDEDWIPHTASWLSGLVRLQPQPQP